MIHSPLKTYVPITLLGLNWSGTVEQVDPPEVEWAGVYRGVPVPVVRREPVQLRAHLNTTGRDAAERAMAAWRSCERVAIRFGLIHAEGKVAAVRAWQETTKTVVSEPIEMVSPDRSERETVYRDKVHTTTTTMVEVDWFGEAVGWW
jgi:hypothetical protein